MGDAHAQALDVRHILRLSTALAEQILGLDKTDHPLSENEVAALVKAARFLYDNDVPWPAVVQKAIDMLAEQMEAVRATAIKAAAEAGLDRL
ncbi:hypothetical protein [Methylobacterium sp. CM6257]|jgi:hypothetical protein